MTMAAEDLVRAGVAAVGDVSNTLASLAPLAGGRPRRDRLPRGVRPHAAAASATRSRRRTGLRARAPAPAARAARRDEPARRLLDPPRRARGAAPRPARARSTSPRTRRSAPSWRAAPAPSPHLVARMGGRAARPRPAGALGGGARRAAPRRAPPRGPLRGPRRRGPRPPARLRGRPSSSARARTASSPGGCRRLDALLAAGIPLAIGTDSLASSPSLAPLADVAVLRRAFPAVPAERVVALAWNGAAVGAPHVGRARAGQRAGRRSPPRLGGARVDDPFEFLVAYGAEERPFEWLAPSGPGGLRVTARPPPPRTNPPARDRRPRRPRADGEALALALRAAVRGERGGDRAPRRRASSPGASCSSRSRWWRRAPPPWR